MFYTSLTSIADAESLQVIFDPEKITYSSLLEFFYKMHDPTTKNRQGADTGTQYRSAIFYHNEEQEKEAREITDKAQKQWWKSSQITTEILPAGEWWDAEVCLQTNIRLGGLRLRSTDIPSALFGKQSGWI